MRLLQCRMLQMTPLSKVKQRYSAAYMGSTASIPPDGDGIKTLPWLANHDIKVHADFKHVLLGGDLQPTQRDCRILINQEAIWKKLSGGAVETLPYPADDSSKKAATIIQQNLHVSSSDLYSRQSRGTVAQAVWST